MRLRAVRPCGSRLALGDDGLQCRDRALEFIVPLLQRREPEPQLIVVVVRGDEFVQALLRALAAAMHVEELDQRELGLRILGNGLDRLVHDASRHRRRAPARSRNTASW